MPCEISLSRVLVVKEEIHKRMIAEDRISLIEAQNTLNNLIWERESREKNMFDEAQVMLFNAGRENV